MYQSKRRSRVGCRRGFVYASALLRCPVDPPGLGEPDLVGFGVCETDESLSLLDQGIAIHSGQGLDWFDLEGSLTTAPLGLPRPADQTVDEHGGRNHAVLRGDRFAILLGDDAGAIGVREDQVVELGQEARRSRSVRVGHWGVGHIEEFFPALVAEDAKAPPETFDHLAEPAQARPGLHVLDGGRAERPEVAQYRLLEGRGWVQGAPEPGLRCGVGGWPTLSPDTPGRDLNQRYQVANGAGEGGRVPLRPLLLQEHP